MNAAPPLFFAFSSSLFLLNSLIKGDQIIMANGNPNPGFFLP